MFNTDLYQAYGACETNNLAAVGLSDIHDKLDGGESWDSPDLARVIRLRLLSDPGLSFWDVSYCYGQRHDGSYCRVGLPFSQLPKRGFRRFIVEQAIKAGVHAKRLGVLDNISTLC